MKGFLFVAKERRKGKEKRDEIAAFSWFFSRVVSMPLLLGFLGPSSGFGGQPEFVATQVHQATEQVYGLAWGEFDPGHDGMEVACLTQSGSVLQLSAVLSGWHVALRCGGTLDIRGKHSQPTIGIGDVYSDHPGNEIVIESEDGPSPSDIIMLFYDLAEGWTYHTIVTYSSFMGGGWGARVGDFDPRLSGDEIFHLYEGIMDIGTGTVLSNIDPFTWPPYDEELIYGGFVAIDSAVGDFDPNHAGPEIVIVTEMGPAYEIIALEATGEWMGREIWDDYSNAGWTVEIADVDPCYPGNEIVYGTRYSNSIMMSRHDGNRPHELQILFTGNATGDTRNIWDIAAGDTLPEAPGLEILGVDKTGSVYLVRRVEDTWQGQVIWQDPNDPLYAVVAGDFLPKRSGDEILVGGESGTIMLLTLKFTGDFTGDGKVNFRDFAELARYLGQNEPSVDVAPWPYGDGTVNTLDTAVLTDNWLQSTYWAE